MKSIYMDNRWGILQQEKEKGKAITYIYEKDGTRIVYPSIKRKAGEVNGVKYFDLVTPRGQCGPWIEKYESGNIIDLVYAFNEEFTKYCAQEHIIAEYIRFSPWLDQAQNFNNIYDIRSYGFVYCNDLKCDFFKEEYSSKKRSEIRKAKKNGIEIVFDTSSDATEDFLRLYNFTEAKYDVSDYYTIDKKFVQKYFEILSDETVFAQAVYEGEVVSSAMILLGEDIAHYHFAANNPKYNSLEGNSLLLYESSLYAAERGKKIFDFGGAKSGSSLERFKKQFVYRAKDYPYDLGTKIRNNKIYNELVNQVGGPREGYFPAYRRD